jgi:hypothetical protein
MEQKFALPAHKFSRRGGGYSTNREYESEEEGGRRSKRGPTLFRTARRTRRTPGDDDFHNQMQPLKHSKQLLPPTFC